MQVHCAHINFDSRHFGNRYCNHYSLKRKKNKIENKEKVGHFHDFFCFLMTFQLTSQITNNVIVRDNGFFVEISCHTTLIYLPLKFFTITYLQTTFFIKLGKPWWGPLMWIFEIVLWWFTVFRNMKWLCYNTQCGNLRIHLPFRFYVKQFAFWRFFTNPKIASLSNCQNDKW